MAIHKFQKRLMLSRSPSLRSPWPSSWSRSCAVSASPRPKPFTTSTTTAAPAPSTSPSSRSASSYASSTPDRNGSHAVAPPDRETPVVRRGTTPSPAASGTTQMARLLVGRLDEARQRSAREAPADTAAPGPSRRQAAHATHMAASAVSETSVAWARTRNKFGGPDVDQSIVRSLASRRQYRAGDIYTPYDLEPREREMRRPPPRAPTRDVFDALGVDPIESYKNPALLAEFMTTMGRLRKRTETGLRPVNQRRLSKAVRRATGMGLMPTVRPHPELMRRDTPWQY